MMRGQRTLVIHKHLEGKPLRSFLYYCGQTRLAVLKDSLILLLIVSGLLPIFYAKSANITHVMRSRSSGPAGLSSYILENSSMWAMGANARTIPPRRRYVPLVTWSPRAVAAVSQAWSAAQREPCTRTLYVYPSFWGITSQIRDYGDAALVSLAFNRPLRHLMDARQPKWCAENSWLGCFFDGFDEQPCRTELNYLQTFRPNTSTPKLRVDTFDSLNGPDSLVTAYLSDFSFVLDDAIFFPTKVWEGLLVAKLVRILDSMTGTALDPAILKRMRPNVYHTLAVSALRTILVPAVFAPREHIRQAAARKIKAMHLQGARPCVSLHLRWTDKSADGGISTQMRPTADFVVPALERVAQITGRSHRCLLLLTDDDKHAMPLLMRTLGNRDLHMIVLTRVSEFFDRAEDYELYARVGHSYLQDLLLQNTPERAFAYFREVIVDIVCAAALSDILIGVGSSGVSQLLAQYMGHAHRIDANAMALWQEDLLGARWMPA